MILLLRFSILLFYPLFSNAQPKPSVSTHLGSMDGITHKLAGLKTCNIFLKLENLDGTTVNAYLGVRYAQAPDAMLRFEVRLQNFSNIIALVKVKFHQFKP